MEPKLNPHDREVFRRALTALNRERVRYVVAGAFALNHYTGVWRYTKDLDVFCEPIASQGALSALARAGFQTYVEEKHWLGKAVLHDTLVDVIWAGGNWATFVDEGWFGRAHVGRVLGIDVLVASPEDIVLSKAYVAGRERFDGADIAHLIHACGEAFNWDDLAVRFGDHWPLLLHYMVLFRFVYPEDRETAPARIVHELAMRIGTEDETTDGLTFRGPLLDRYGYLHDLHAHGRPDPREVLAARAGLPVADVKRRRLLDKLALEDGRVTPSRPNGRSTRPTVRARKPRDKRHALSAHDR
ncbi:MAG: hypothetical protein HY698_18655 [Deltaproteobacteria bacterium]|nr:hypothetical protein [Deltaproteobacteria bacterium]